MKTTVLLFLFVTALMIASAIREKNNEVKKAVYRKAALVNGENIYNTYCLTCHMADGGGVPNMNPPLIKTSYVQGDKKKLIEIVLNGMSRQEIDGENYNNIMPPFNFLKNKEIADVLTYVRGSFGNNAGSVSEAEVKSVRKKLVSAKK